MRLILRILPLLFCLPAAAQAQNFVLPLNCTLGLDCAVLSYQDTQERIGDMQDPLCGTRTRDDQIGTVFAVPNLAAADLGVDVRAIDDGQIENIEMRWPDQPGQGCGNGVIIRHKSGWTSRYCGLRQNSSTLAKDAYVKKGQRIGLAGITGGRLPWPGLFFSLERYGRPYDLWTGQAVTAGCRFNQPLVPGLTYQRLALIQAGITSPLPPAPGRLIKGVTAPPFIQRTEPIVAWAQVEGLQKNDQVRFTFSQNGATLWQGGGAVDPSSPLLTARREAPKSGWTAGTVLVKIDVGRGGKIYASTTQSIKIK